MTADGVLQLMLFAYGMWGIGMWLTGWFSQREATSKLRTRLSMIFVFGFLAVGAIVGLFSFIGLAMVAFAKWNWPFYLGLVAGGAYMFGMTMVQLAAMRRFDDWSDGIAKAKVDEQVAGRARLTQIRFSRSRIGRV